MSIENLTVDPRAAAALNNIVVDGYHYFNGDFAGAIARAEALSNDPDNASEETQLHAIADFLDILDIESGSVGEVQMQRFLRGLADRFNKGEVAH